MIIVANLIVTSFMGQSNFESKLFKSENQKHSSFFKKRIQLGEGSDRSKLFHKRGTKSLDFSLATKQKLDSLIFQDFDENLNDWLDYEKLEYSYDSHGWVMNKIQSEKGIGTWIPYWKNEWAYNANGLLSREVSFHFDIYSSKWIRIRKNDFEYDEAGNMTVEQSYHWNSELNQWDIRYKYEYTYNSNSTIQLSTSSHWDTELNQWLVYYKMEFTYDENDNLYFQQGYVWDEDISQWILDMKIEYAYNVVGDWDMLLGYNWDKDSGQWILFGKLEFVYDSNNILVLISLFDWDDNLEDWIGDYKAEYIYDFNENVVESNEYVWNETSGEWEYDIQNDLSYDNSFSYDDLVLPSEIKEDSQMWGVNFYNHMLTNLISSYYNDTLLEDQEKVELYYSSIEVGIGENQMISATVYPNPATDYVSFRLDEGPRKMQVEIIDMFGKVVLSQQISNTEQISVQQLKPALYFYRLSDGIVIFSSGKMSVQ